MKMKIHYSLFMKLSQKKSKYNIINFSKSLTKKIEDYYLDENLELFKSEIRKEREKEFRTKQKEFYFKKIYGKKIELFNQSNQSTNNKSKPRVSGLIKNKPKGNSLSEYISHIKNNYKENPLEFESINITNNKNHYKFSLCFICHYPVIAYEDKVICVNGCFKFDVKTSIFNDDYTLDNFSEDYYKFCQEHLLCNGDVKLISIDSDEKTAIFKCDICDKDNSD